MDNVFWIPKILKVFQMTNHPGPFYSVWTEHPYIFKNVQIQCLLLLFCSKSLLPEALPLNNFSNHSQLFKMEMTLFDSKIQRKTKLSTAQSELIFWWNKMLFLFSLLWKRNIESVFGYSPCWASPSFFQDCRNVT